MLLPRWFYNGAAASARERARELRARGLSGASEEALALGFEQQVEDDLARARDADQLKALEVMQRRLAQEQAERELDNLYYAGRVSQCSDYSCDAGYDHEDLADGHYPQFQPPQVITVCTGTRPLSKRKRRRLKRQKVYVYESIKTLKNYGPAVGVLLQGTGLTLAEWQTDCEFPELIDDIPGEAAIAGLAFVACLAGIGIKAFFVPTQILQGGAIAAISTLVLGTIVRKMAARRLLRRARELQTAQPRP